MASEITQAILLVVSNIPHGEVMSYGQVAERAGLPGYARHVGNVLKQLTSDTAIPWHRVVKSGNYLAFAEGSSAYLRQRERLESEGWRVDRCKLK